MISGLERAKSHRVWFVPEFSAWGLAGWSEIEFLAAETVQSTTSILYGTIGIGDTAQQVTFSDLTDHRGNALPSSLASPRVIVRPRSVETAFVVGEESDQSFKIARDPEALGPVMVDLVIIEMGE
jgi:hypothetical protein